MSSLPQNAIYYFTKANLPRALNERDLMRFASEFGLKGQAYETVKLAVDAAKSNAKSQDIIYIGGSTFIVAEALLV